MKRSQLIRIIKEEISKLKEEFGSSSWQTSLQALTSDDHKSSFSTQEPSSQISSLDPPTLKKKEKSAGIIGQLPKGNLLNVDMQIKVDGRQHKIKLTSKPSIEIDGSVYDIRSTLMPKIKSITSDGFKITINTSMGSLKVNSDLVMHYLRPILSMGPKRNIKLPVGGGMSATITRRT